MDCERRSSPELGCEGNDASRLMAECCTQPQASCDRQHASRSITPQTEPPVTSRHRAVHPNLCSHIVFRYCPAWDRTKSLLLQRQTCCQLHHGAALRDGKARQTAATRQLPTRHTTGAKPER